MEVLLVFSRKLDCSLCVTSAEAEGTNGAVRTAVLEVELLETVVCAGEPRTPARSITLFRETIVHTAITL